MFEDHIHAAPCRELFHFTSEFAGVQQGIVRAQLPRLGELRLRTRSGDHTSAGGFRNLKGGASDAATRRDHEHGFGRAKMRAIEKHVPRRQKDEWNRGGFLKREVARDGNRVHCRREDELSISTVDLPSEEHVVWAKIIAPGEA